MEWYFGNEVEEDVVVPKTYGQISSSSSSPEENWPQWGLVNSSFPKKNETSQSTITQDLSGFWNNEADYQHFAEEEARINHMNDIFFGSLLEDYPTYKDSTRPHDNTILGNNVFEDDMLNSQTAWGNGEVSTMPKQQYTSNENMEESVLNDLERVTAQFTDRTRICFRDAFYRLAESSKQSCRDGEPVITCIDDTLRTEGGGGESKTNVIDRAVASLMFHKNEYYEDAQAQPTAY